VPTPELWAWKHEQSPFGPSLCLVAEEGGRLIGLRAFMRWEWRGGGERLRAARPVDTVTHPDARGRGVFSQLTRAGIERLNAEGVDFVFNTPNRASLPGYLKLGWESMGRQALWVLPRLRVSRLPAWLRLLQERGAMDWQAPPPAPTGPFALDPEAVDRVLGAADGGGGLRTALDEAYLHWRYLAAPGIAYQLELPRRGQAAALLVTRESLRQGLRELKVGELALGPGWGSVRLAARRLREVASERGADYVVASARVRSRAGAALALAGFLRVPRAGPLVAVRDLSAPAAQAWARCAPAVGDLELF
jgi:GNAT superfamily N-acetyltransferase